MIPQSSRVPTNYLSKKKHHSLFFPRQKHKTSVCFLINHVSVFNVRVLPEDFLHRLYFAKQALWPTKPLNHFQSSHRVLHEAWTSSHPIKTNVFDDRDRKNKTRKCVWTIKCNQVTSCADLRPFDLCYNIFKLIFNLLLISLQTLHVPASIIKTDRLTAAHRGRD